MIQTLSVDVYGYYTWLPGFIMILFLSLIMLTPLMQNIQRGADSRRLMQLLEISFSNIPVAKAYFSHLRICDCVSMNSKFFWKVF